MNQHLTRPPTFSDRLERVLLVALVLLPPLFVWFWGYDGYMFPKRILISVIVAGMAGMAMGRAASGNAFRIQVHPIMGLFAAWWAWSVLSLTWAASSSLAFERIVWLTIVGVAMLLVQNQWIGRRGVFIRLAQWLVVAAVLLSIWALFMDFWGLVSPATVPVVPRLGDWRDRVSVAGLGNTGHIADFIVLAFPAALMLYLHRWGSRARVLLLICLWLMAAALIVCWSVHSNASLIVVMLLGLPFLFRLHPRQWWRRRMKPVGLLVAGWAAVVVFYVAPQPLNPHPGGIFHEAFSSTRWKEGWPTRVAIWETSLQMISQHVLFGVGAGNFTYVYPSVDSELVRLNPDLAEFAGRWTNAAHNEILQNWAETGIVGLGLLVALVGGALLILIRRMREETKCNRMILWCAALGLGAWTLQAQMNFPLQTPVAALLFGLFLSVPIALAPRYRNRPSAVLFPVEMERWGVRLTVYMKNMRVPCRVSVETVWGNAGRRIVGIVAGAIFVAVSIIGVRGLLAEMQLRYGKQAAGGYIQMQSRLLISQGNWQNAARLALDAGQPHYRKAVAFWPRLTDARSAWTDLLVRAGQYQEALRQNAIVRRRLDADEIYFREAWSRLNIHEDKKAAQAFSVIRKRSVAFDQNHDGIPDNLTLDPFWAAVYFQLIRKFPPPPHHPSNKPR